VRGPKDYGKLVGKLLSLVSNDRILEGRIQLAIRLVFHRPFQNEKGNLGAFLGLLDVESHATLAQHFPKHGVRQECRLGQAVFWNRKKAQASGAELVVQQGQHFSSVHGRRDAVQDHGTHNHVVPPLRIGVDEREFQEIGLLDALFHRMNVNGADVDVNVVFGGRIGQRRRR